MRVRGDNKPAAFTVERQPKKPGRCLVRFYENAQEYTETADGHSTSGWEYDEYHLEMAESACHQADIEANYDTLLAQAKQAEENAKPIDERMQAVEENVYSQLAEAYQTGVNEA